MIIEYSENNEARVRWKHASTDEWKTAELDDLILAYEKSKEDAIGKRVKYIQIGKDRFDFPLKKTGKWIPHIEKSREYIGTVLINVEYDYWFCNSCGYRVESGQPMYKYCPNCGAKMEG